MTRTLIICWHGPRKDGQGQSGIRRSSAVFLGLLERGVIGQGTIAWTRLCVYPRSSCKLTHRRPLGPVAAVCAVCVCLLARGGWASRDLSSSLDFLTHRQRDGRWVFCIGVQRDRVSKVKGEMEMSEYKNPEVLVTTESVAQNLNAPNTRLVEVDVDTTAYDQGHIPGAVGWNWQTQLQDNVRRDLIEKPALEKLLGESGISNDTTILLYGDNNNWFAAYAFWQLKYYGHKNVKLINGGRKKWLEEKRALTKDATKVTPATYRVASTDESLRALRDEVLSVVQGKKRGQLVDVRSVDEFTGKIIAPPGMTETAQRAGHIPNAANVPWAQAANEDGTFKSAEALAALYQGKGVNSNDEVIAYCRIGERSSHTWFVLKYLLGYNNVKNYDGSWTEWGNLIGSPIVNETASNAKAASAN